MVARVDFTPLLLKSTGPWRELVKALVEEIDLPSIQLTPAQEQALKLLRTSRIITACWVADQEGKSSLTASNGKNLKPFRSQDFKDRKRWAEYLISLVNLCSKVFEVFGGGQDYTKAEDWWLACVGEWKRWQIDYILSADLNTFYKVHKIKGLTTGYLAAKSGINPFLKQDGQRHHYWLVEMATRGAADLPVMARIKFKQKFWTRFLTTLQNYIDDIKGSDLKAPVLYDDKLKCQEHGREGRFDFSTALIITVDTSVL